MASTRKFIVLAALSFALASVLIYISLVTYGWYLQDFQSYQAGECWEPGKFCRVHLFDFFYRDSIIAAIAGSFAAVIGIAAIAIEKRNSSAKAWLPISASVIVLIAVFTGYFFTISYWT